MGSGELVFGGESIRSCEECSSDLAGRIWGGYGEDRGRIEGGDKEDMERIWGGDKEDFGRIWRGYKPALDDGGVVNETDAEHLGPKHVGACKHTTTSRYHSTQARVRA